MGWRTQDAYDRDADARRRALPWRQRYNWPVLALVVLWLAVVAFGVAFGMWLGARM